MMNDKKTVVIFNSPANSGKDVATDFMVNYFQAGKKLSFKDALYQDVADYFGISKDVLIEYHSDRKLKETPSHMFPKYQTSVVKQSLLSIPYTIGKLFNVKRLMSIGYYSSREALIHVSEDIVKPTFGNDVYGKLLAREIENSSESFYFIADGGFFNEVVPLLDKGYNVYIVQLERNGCTFEGDSRKMLTKEDFKGYNNIKFIKLDNNGTLDDLYNNIVDLSYDLAFNNTQEKYGGNIDGYEVVHL